MSSDRVPSKPIGDQPVKAVRKAPTPPQAPPSNPLTELARVRRRQPKHATKCIYFADAEQLMQTEQLALRGTGSVSNVVQQLVAHLVRCASTAPANARSIKLTELEVFL